MNAVVTHLRICSLYLCRVNYTFSHSVTFIVKAREDLQKALFVVSPTFVVVSVTISALFSLHFSALGISYTPIYNALK